MKNTSFNDVFIRELKDPLIPITNSDIIYAPATSRAIFFNFKNFYKLNLYIKGKNFNLPDLINEPQIRSKYSIMICRLAINDYHYIHMPEDGILIEISEYNGTYKSIDKDYIRSNINVMNDNKRVIFKFKRSNDTLFYLVAIGSTIISSIIYDLNLNQNYLTKEKIAYFQFGGSCVVYVSDQNVYYDKDLAYFSNENIESYVKVGDEVGNLYNQKNFEFIKYYNIKRHINGFLNNLIEIIINFFIKIHQKYLKNLSIELI
jgi:phosphatidylserine decarboxylase precursor